MSGSGLTPGGGGNIFIQGFQTLIQYLGNIQQTLVNLISAINAAATLLAAAFSGGGGGSTNVATIAALRALASGAAVVYVEGYYAASDGGGGTYIKGTAGPADNGGTIIVSANGTYFLETGGLPVSVKVFGAKGDGSTNDSTTLQAALTWMGSVGGGVVYMPPTGFAYLISTGLSVPGGVTLRGAASRWFAGTTATLAQWTAGGTWLHSTDVTNSATTFTGHGSAIEGISYIYTQPVPGGSFTPTTFPYAIALASSGAGDFCNLNDIMIIAATHGISWVYPALNGGGTGVNWKNILISAFVIGIHTDNVNDVMCWDDIHVRNLYYASNTVVAQYCENNLFGWDCHYTDNPMIKGLEFFQCATGIFLTDGTCVGNTHSLYNALITDVQHFGNHFVQVASTTTHTTAQLTNVLTQTDTTQTALSGTMFSLNSNNVFWTITNVRIFAGGIGFNIGGGATGNLVLDGLWGDYTISLAGQTFIVVNTGASLVLGNRTIIKSGSPGQYIAGAGAGEINTPHDWDWSPYSALHQFSVTGLGIGTYQGFSLSNFFNPITTGKIQGRIYGQLNVITPQGGGTANIQLSNFTEIVATGISVAAAGLVNFDSGWIDLSSASNPLGVINLATTTSAVVENGAVNMALR